MKKINFFVAIIIALITFQQANAQSDKYERTPGFKKETIKVFGECSMSKHRIENAVKSIEGVRSASWDINSKLLKIEYSIFKKDMPDVIRKKLTALGHDTDKLKADDMAYQKLPVCCRYERQSN
ncbi:MAG: cation transporter [Sphingobacteriales bacterium]|nr:MAG: cation transporter [Sphingobacteriales bacterium]